MVSAFGLPTLATQGFWEEQQGKLFWGLTQTPESKEKKPNTFFFFFRTGIIFLSTAKDAVRSLQPVSFCLLCSPPSLPHTGPTQGVKGWLVIVFSGLQCLHFSYQKKIILSAAMIQNLLPTGAVFSVRLIPHLFLTVPFGPFQN